MKVKVNLRLEKETDERLETMAKGTKRTKGAIIEILVDMAWDKFVTKGRLDRIDQALSLNDKNGQNRN